DTLSLRPICSVQPCSKVGASFMPAAHVEVSLRMVGAFTALHWLVFEILGALASSLLILAEHDPDLGFGVLLGFVLSAEGLVGGAMMVAEPVLQAFAWPAGPPWPSRRAWSDGRLSVASACADGDLSLGQGPRRTSNTKGRACQRTT